MIDTSCEPTESVMWGVGVLAVFNVSLLVRQS